MRVAIVTESFLPSINGVTNSVLRVLDHLKTNGHHAIIIAPESRQTTPIHHYRGYPVIGTSTIMFPLINSLPIPIPNTSLRKQLTDFHPDVVHLASPFVLAGGAALVTKKLHIPTVGVYQTDIAGFSTKYKLSLLEHASWKWTKTIHNNCTLTLAPSTAAVNALNHHGIHRVHRWGRGVDSTTFHPNNCNTQLRTTWDPTGTKHIIGFVGRLAAEKGLHRLAPIDAHPNLQLVIVGNGPHHQHLRQLLPNAHFTGALHGHQLAQAYASMDIFVHPGEFETFCQTIQEAHASGIPTIAPAAGGPLDLITPGTNGTLLNTTTFTQDLIPAIEEILNPTTYPAMARAARAGVENKTWDALCGTLMDYYRMAINESAHSH